MFEWTIKAVHTAWQKPYQAEYRAAAKHPVINELEAACVLALSDMKAIAVKVDRGLPSPHANKVAGNLTITVTCMQDKKPWFASTQQYSGMGDGDASALADAFERRLSNMSPAARAARLY
jgi:hypothetical protein